MENKPNPATKEAIELGCECHIIDNHYGMGSGYNKPDGTPCFWISERCPIHDVWDGEL